MDKFKGKLTDKFTGKIFSAAGSDWFISAVSLTIICSGVSSTGGIITGVSALISSLTILLSFIIAGSLIGVVSQISSVLQFSTISVVQTSFSALLSLLLIVSSLIIVSFWLVASSKTCRQDSEQVSTVSGLQITEHSLIQTSLTAPLIFSSWQTGKHSS